MLVRTETSPASRLARPGVRGTAAELRGSRQTPPAPAAFASAVLACSKLAFVSCRYNMPGLFGHRAQRHDLAALLD
jgi:hypothetical protein